MEKADVGAKGGIFFSCKTERYQIKEMIMQDHVLTRIVSGESRVVHADSTYVFEAGSTLLVPRTQLGKVTKCPKDGEPYKSVTIFFTQGFLQRYYASRNPMRAPQDTPDMITFNKHPLLESLFDSMLPYFTLTGELPADVAAIKVEEAITVLRAIDPNVDSILGHFADPGKIALADFMEKNYMFNLSMEKFGYLTGRSLSTFKRDFRNAFNTTFQKWVTRKRLELAHYHIFEQNENHPTFILKWALRTCSIFHLPSKSNLVTTPQILSE
jgi:AraC-like DNA-binding protein